MITISLCMIVKDEEEYLEQCLSSVKDIADEIIIVDTGSTDRTKEIAAKFTDHIYDFAWIDDFSAARNFSYSKASMDYILWLDADDRILSQDRSLFLKLKESLEPDIDAVMMQYHTGFDQNGNVTFSYFRERLSKRECHFLWQEPVHEYLSIGGKTINSEISITHMKRQSEPSTDRNLQIYENLIKKGRKLSPRGIYYYARELKEHKRYPDAIKYFRRFLDSGLGWVEDNITACENLADCYLQEKQDEKALGAMMRSFSYDTPRAELCCQIGFFFLGKDQYRQAAFWFELALKLDKPKGSWGFIQEDCWGYLPCIECVVCYDRLGEYKKAEAFNDRAATYHPDAPEVVYNKLYFERRKQAEEETAGS